MDSIRRQAGSSNRYTQAQAKAALIQLGVIQPNHQPSSIQHIGGVKYIYDLHVKIGGFKPTYTHDGGVVVYNKYDSLGNPVEFPSCPNTFFYTMCSDSTYGSKPVGRIIYPGHLYGKVSPPVEPKPKPVQTISSPSVARYDYYNNGSRATSSSTTTSLTTYTAPRVSSEVPVGPPVRAPGHYSAEEKMKFYALQHDANGINYTPYIEGGKIKVPYR